MMTDRLGKIERVHIKDIWSHEAFDFTPWLAEEPNVAQLAEAVGLELEIENVEVSVGPYSADILAKDVGTGKYVIIENQYGKTNHDHLGKVITYGSFLDAAAVIWIAESFTDEHQMALDWLNDHSTEDVAFYGVSLELWKIDDSKPAVRFNVVSRPKEIVRQASAVKDAGKLTGARQLQLDFWTEFRSQLLAKKVVRTAQTPRPQYWFDVALGRSHFALSNIADTYGGRIGVRVYISNKVAHAALTQLELQKAEIETEIGEALQWNPNPDARDKVIALYRTVDLEAREHWPEYCDWFVDRVARFRKAFVPRIKKLDLELAVADRSDEHG